MKNIEFKNIMKSILIKQDAKYSLDNYAFVCSKIWDDGLIEYKGVPIYYFNAELMGDIIQLIPSPIMKDYV
jgi:hypothetical protein